MPQVILVSFALFISGFAYAKNCGLEVGAKQTRILNNKAIIITRLPDNPQTLKARYEIKMPVYISPAEKMNDPNYKHKILALANRCYREATPYLLGPDGEEITLALAPLKKQPPAHFSKLNIHAGFANFPEGHISMDANCPTLMQETMHILGLPELRPRRLSCSPIGPIHSILYDPYEAYRTAGAPLNHKDWLWVYKNECGQQKKDQPNQGKYLHCERMKKEAKGEYPSVEAVAAFNERGLGEKTPAFRYSLFHPNEARALLYSAECNKGAEIFKDCSVNSFRTEVEGCLQTPTICSQGNFDWLHTQDAEKSGLLR